MLEKICADVRRGVNMFSFDCSSSHNVCELARAELALPFFATVHIFPLIAFIA